MMKRKVHNLLLAMLIGNFALAPAFAGDKPNLLEKALGINKQAVLDPKMEAWFLSPGVKSTIETGDDRGKFINIVADGSSIKFVNCECNVYPNCPDLMEPYYTFTPEEVLTRTSTWAGKSHTIFEVFLGGLFLAGQQASGLPSFLGPMLQAFGFLGAIINPQQKAENEKHLSDIADKIISVGAKAVKDQSDPVAVVEFGGTFESVSVSVTEFLKGLGGKDLQSYYSAQHDQYEAAVAKGTAKPMETCDRQILEKEDQEISLEKQILQNQQQMMQQQQQQAPAAPAELPVPYIQN